MAWPPPLPPATEPNRPQSTRRWVIIPAIVIGAVVLAIARLRWRYYDVPPTYRETCRAGDEVLSIGGVSFLVACAIAAVTLVLGIRHRWGLAVAFGAATVGLVVLVPLAGFVAFLAGDGHGFICDERPD